MKPLNEKKIKSLQHGVTLIEMTVVILVLLLLTSISVVSVGAYRSWAAGTEAAQELRVIYNAQRAYLAENPTVDPTALTSAEIIPYLSTGKNVLPVIEDLDGNALVIDLTKVPAVVTVDPSGGLSDGLWDVGNL